MEDIIRRHSSFLPFPVYVAEKHVNTTPALWREPKSSVTKEQYTDFYKFLTYDKDEPLGTIHFATDSPIQFNMLVFIPNQELDIALAQREQYGLDLYAKRILINRDNKELVPNYLAFLKGVVDSEDLPLNISRETLQENLVIRKIQQTLTKQALKYLERTASENEELYAKIWNTHGQIFKLGYSDYLNKDSYMSLLRFNSSAEENDEVLVGFEKYTQNAKANYPLIVEGEVSEEGKQESKQKYIWYISAPNREACKLNPLYETFRRRNIEVLFLYEPIDEIVLESVGEYQGFSFKGIEFATEEDLKDFPEIKDENDTPPLKDEEKPMLDNLISAIKACLGDLVKDVRTSSRLASAPAALVGADGTSSSMEKLMRAMTKDTTPPKKIFEINPDHQLVRNLLTIYKANPDDVLLNDMIQTLFETTQLLDGYIQDPHTLANRVNNLLQKSSAWYTEIKKD